MTSVFAPQSSATAQMLPLSPADKMMLYNQKKIFNFIFSGIALVLAGFMVFQAISLDSSIGSAFLIPGPSLLVMCCRYSFFINK
ncbi:hypothetical protein [Larkinella rosea]|uniref:Uncharacterized protein n=1 Tax=Larkinella rosea TaxID=2025312 RepID=A0A3P1BIF1_9BACT|nr:hypothetical protein [Larkinella rosea]RRB00765.1 hypothetical protein EHT25_21450 [Larkinella rosea]